MKRLIKIIVFLLTLLIFASCNNDSESDLPQGIPLEFYESLNEDKTAMSSMAKNDYNCEISYDDLTGEFSGNGFFLLQNDSEYPYMLEIEFDLICDDYNVDKVSIYEAENADQDIFYGNDLPYCWERPEAEIELSLLTNSINIISDLNTYEIIRGNSISYNQDFFNNEILDTVSDLYSGLDLGEYCVRAEYKYNYKIRELLNEESEYDFDEFEANDTASVYYLRSWLDGLPVGMLKNNYASFNYVKYNDLYGRIGLYGTTHDQICNPEISCIVDVNICNYKNPVIIESNLDVMPFQECIDNSVEGIVNDYIRGRNNKAIVYRAELIYMPFEDGYMRIADSTYRLYLVPVWAIYYSYFQEVYEIDEVECSQNIHCSTIYLNAVTGELLKSL